jgi:hypothetical protein
MVFAVDTFVHNTYIIYGMRLCGKSNINVTQKLFFLPYVKATLTSKILIPFNSEVLGNRVWFLMLVDIVPLSVSGPLLIPGILGGGGGSN